MSFKLFTQLGKWVDGILNWFFNLNPIWQLLCFLFFVIIGIIIYFQIKK